MNREFRKIAGLPCKIYVILVGTCSSPCTCCRKSDKKKHDCTHDYCEPNCSKKYENTYTRSNIHLIKDNRSIVNKDGTIKKSVFAINK